MKDEIVCLCLKTLFQTLFTGMSSDDEVYTRFSHCLRREPNTVDGDYYYDLYKTKTSGYRLCCDGEQCKVLEQTESYVKLIDVENIDNEELDGIDTTFKLSIDEYNIAVFS